jgi:HSP20 family molecular chaperone IbpA
MNIKSFIDKFEKVKKINNIRSHRKQFICLSKFVQNRFATFKNYMLSEYSVPVIGFGDLNIDVCDHNQKFEIRIEIPGVPEEDIRISSLENKLIINAEKKAAKNRNQKNYYIMECAYGSFMRSIPLPFNINSEKVTANLEKGVLTIIVTKPINSEETEKVIEIKSKK